MKNVYGKEPIVIDPKWFEEITATGAYGAEEAIQNLRAAILTFEKTYKFLTGKELVVTPRELDELAVVKEFNEKLDLYVDTEKEGQLRLWFVQNLRDVYCVGYESGSINTEKMIKSIQKVAQKDTTCKQLWTGEQWVKQNCRPEDRDKHGTAGRCDWCNRPIEVVTGGITQII